MRRGQPVWIRGSISFLGIRLMLAGIADGPTAPPFLSMACLASDSRAVLLKTFSPLSLSKRPGWILTQLLCISRM